VFSTQPGLHFLVGASPLVQGEGDISGMGFRENSFRLVWGLSLTPLWLPQDIPQDILSFSLSLCLSLSLSLSLSPSHTHIPGTIWVVELQVHILLLDCHSPHPCTIRTFTE
jgi:hypothetical protein